ncbi:hypothetical protein CspeluHIS016_0307680 [Cutaneotrichosporon spelunceum]|uniref:Mid2 domain-containing protein n=1 Tax=Cutaneotrichosporon spelunceum TaxID=1672016 RepID=A0AAD3TUP2_9TREE|nr:hypothetical protein CspeluHIS016_0307680 [Cutaneotrichosporon spelunceum]
MTIVYFLFLAFLGFAVSAQDPQVTDIPAPKSTFLPEGPTTVVYTWTYPYTQTKTVTYGGPGWTTYIEYATVDGTLVVKTVVAPTREVATASISPPGADRNGDKFLLWVLVLVLVLAVTLFGVLAGWYLLRGRKKRAAATPPTVPVVKKSPSIASSDASSTYSKEEA